MILKSLVDIRGIMKVDVRPKFVINRLSQFEDEKQYEIPKHISNGRQEKKEFVFGVGLFLSSSRF